MKSACATGAGFFTLWHTPRAAFGKELPLEGRHEAFNRAVIAETGIVGVHFSSTNELGLPEPLIRYAVCADVLDRKFQERLEAGLDRIQPVY